MGKPFDIDLLDEYRTEVATELRNAAFYEYKASHLVYTVDTLKSKSTVFFLNPNSFARFE